VPNDQEKQRLAIWKAVQVYLGQPVELKNVAHALVPIRFQATESNTDPSNSNMGRLEVDIVARGPEEDEDEDDDEEESGSVQSEQTTDESGKLVLIRMVNRIPLLDCSEAVACGLVQGLVAKKSMWRSFGLDVTFQPNPADPVKLPVYHVKDSDQVAPFFEKRNHAVLREASDDEKSDSGKSDSDKDEEESQAPGDKRKRRLRLFKLLPAKIRLANVLVIVQIHAIPAILPLPTLSKVSIIIRILLIKAGI
jgi:hypothetical protein